MGDGASSFDKSAALRSSALSADATRALMWQLWDVVDNDDIALTLVVIPCTMTRDGGGVVSKLAACVCRFWPAERFGTDSSPLPVTALMGGGHGRWRWHGIIAVRGVHS